MEFDFAQVGVPFRMRPDLRRPQPDARHPTPLRPGSALHTEKLAPQRPGSTRLALASALPHLLRVSANGTHWERHVWTISLSARHDQHPHRHARPLWPDTLEPAALVQQCFFRAERRTFLPLVDASWQPRAQVLFTIRVMAEPLVQVIARRTDAARLCDAIASKSSAMLAYKNLTPARERLLRWLHAHHAEETGAAPQV